MAAFKHILWPVDLTEDNAKLAPYVRYMVDTHGSFLDILFVVRDLSSYGGLYSPYIDLDQLYQHVTNAAAQKLDELLTGPLAGLDRVRTHVATGPVAQTIMDYAKSKKADLIIMGTHGRKGLEFAVFGSIARQVVKSSPVPVLTINPDAV